MRDCTWLWFRGWLPELGADEMHGSSGIERVAGAGMPEPVRGDVGIDTDPPGGLSHDAPQHRLVKPAAGSGPEQRVCRIGRNELLQCAVRLGADQHDARLISLPEDGDLGRAVFPLHESAPVMLTSSETRTPAS